MKSKKVKSTKCGSKRKKVISNVCPSTSLPPLVEGQVRCFLRVSVSRVLWTIPKPPLVTLVRLRWWGETTGGTLFQPRDGSLDRQKDVQSTTRYPVRCGPKQFTSYLTDMGSLVLDVLTKRDHLPIARVQVAGIARVSLSHSINGFYTLVSPTSEKLGELQVTLALEPMTETYDSSSSVPTTDMCADSAGSACDVISDQNQRVTSQTHFGPSNGGRESGGSSISTPRGRDHLYFKERGQTLSGVCQTGIDAVLSAQTDRREPDGVVPSASVDLLSVLLERGSKLRNAMVVSALQSDLDSDVALKNTPLSLPRDSTGAPPLWPLRPSSGQLLQKLLHSDLQPECSPDAHDVAVDLLLGSVNGSAFSSWDGEDSPPESLSGCSSALMDSELNDPQYDQSLLENLFYKATKADGCLTAEGDEHCGKESSGGNARLDSNSKPHAGLKDHFPGLTQDRIELLGRIRAARVMILQLSVTTDSTSRKPSVRKGRPPIPAASKKRSYLVEYLFPLLSAKDDTESPAEVTRVVSSRVVDGVVKFQHQSVFPVHFGGPEVKRWWDMNLTFTIYSRQSHQMKPVPIGASSFSLRTLLQSHRLKITTLLPVQRLDGDANKQEVGPLKVSFELATDKKDFSSKSKLANTATGAAASPQEADVSGVGQGDDEGGEFPHVYKSPHRINPSPSAVRSSQIIQIPPSMFSSCRKNQNSPNKSLQVPDSEESDVLLHTLLMVPDGKDLRCTPMQPNVYLNCKLFGSEETVRSAVSWGQVQPTFSLVQIAPVALTAKLLERMRNNVMVIEVWLRANMPDSDKLLGLVKLPLHQFYMSFRDAKISQLLLQAQYPVVAVDSFMPVVDIFTGGTRGSLRVFLAMGTTQQIASLQHMREKDLSDAPWLPRRAHSLDRRPTAEREVSAPHCAETLNEHVFLVRIEKVKGLTPLQSTVWGEADCYIQYSFPTWDDEGAGKDIEPHVVESTVNLKSFRTGTTLCIPDPVFSHCERHVLLAPPDIPVQRLLLSSLASQGFSHGGGIQFEVWCRYYYPNVREQLVARALLPMAKLCAMVTMQRQGQTEAQLFSLPLVPRSDRPADHQAQPSGLLEVSVQYKTRPVRSGGLRDGSAASRVVNVVVQVHRAAGLQAAARAAALQYYSEVGVNSFVTVRLSLLPETERRCTRVAARSFSPEFEHHTEFCCPLLVQRDTGESVSLAEMLQDAVAVFTLYNRDTRKVIDASKDTILGSVRIRLTDLLYKRTGISGWFGISLPSSAPLHRGLTLAGGLELSISFGHHADRERVLDSARLLGWDVETDSEECEWDEDTSYEKLQFFISIPRAWLPVSSLLLPGQPELQRSTYCYYRYKLYNQEAFCSQLRHPTLDDGQEGEGMAALAFTGTQTVELRKCQPLLWYLREERLEVQLWVSFGKEKRKRPHETDRLVGAAFLDLSALAASSKHKQTISGVYPLFKSSAPDLGGAALRAHVTVTSGPTHQTSSATHLTDGEEDLSSPEEHEEDRGPSSRHSLTPDGPVSMRQPTKSVLGSEEETEGNTFTATVSVERAMHLSLKGCPLTEKGNGLPCCWVSYTTADDPVSTAVVQDSECPVWGHHQECRLSKELLVDPQQLLVFKVWHKGEAERVIGFASVDLSPLLSGFQSVCGWYNITDFSGQCQGQIKVSVSPLMGVQELRAQRQAASEKTATDSSFLFTALPLGYRTTGVYGTPEQEQLFSARSNLIDHHDEHLNNVRRFHETLQAAVPQCVGDAHPSSSALFSALRKNLCELDDIQRYFSHKLSTPAFPALGAQRPSCRQEMLRDSETDTKELLLKSNQLVEEVNGIITGLSERPMATSPCQLRNPLIHSPNGADTFRAMACSSLAEPEACETETMSNKDPVTRLEDLSSPFSPSPVPDGSNHPQDSEDLEEDENLMEDEDFEETLIEPRTLNELTSVTDRTSPWTSVFSDPEESLEHSGRYPVHFNAKETEVSSLAAAARVVISDSDLSDEGESGEDTGRDPTHGHPVSEEHGDERGSSAEVTDEDPVPEGKQATDNDSEESESPPGTESSTKANGESEETKAKLSDTLEIPNFFLPSHHLEASMRALRLAPVFPSTPKEPGTEFRRASRPRPSVPPSAANKEETKRIAKIFASHFTEGS